MNHIALATEDELSEKVGERLAQDAGLSICQYLRRNGAGYLKSRTFNFNQMSSHLPVLLITDLDDTVCAPSLLASWLKAQRRHVNFIFRVAEREIEAWLLADPQAIRQLMGSRIRQIPTNPDEIPDPKQFILNLAARAPRQVRDELIASNAAVASQGIGYNSLLSRMVTESWSPARASEASPSLARARQRLHELCARVDSSR